MSALENDPSDDRTMRAARFTELLADGLTMLETQMGLIAKRQQDSGGELQSSDLTRLEKIYRVAREFQRLVAGSPEPRMTAPGASSSDLSDSPLLRAIALKEERDREADTPSDIHSPLLEALARESVEGGASNSADAT